jgi:hypothetical protein
MEKESGMQVTSIEEAARLYRQLEASIEAKEAKYKASIAKEERALEQLTIGMRAILNTAGVDTMNVPGVAEVKLVRKRAFGCADWDGFMTYIVQNNVPELLQKRIHEGNMQHYIDKTLNGELPPFTNVHTEVTLKLLKPK